MLPPATPDDRLRPEMGVRVVFSARDVPSADRARSVVRLPDYAAVAKERSSVLLAWGRDDLEIGAHIMRIDAAHVLHDGDVKRYGVAEAYVDKYGLDINLEDNWVNDGQVFRLDRR